MSTELLTFGGAVLPMVKAKKEITWLKTLTIAVKAKNKKEAAGAIKQQLEEKLPEHFGCYFAPKIWLDRPGIPRPPVGEFCDDFFETVAVWNPSTGEPEAIIVEHDEDFDNDDAELRHEVNAQLAAERGEYVAGVSDPDAPNWVHEDLGQDSRPLMSNREIEIAHALDELLSGHTYVMGGGEAQWTITRTGRVIADIFPLLIADITATEFYLAPLLSDSEIYITGAEILDNWSDDINVRQRFALGSIVNYRCPASSTLEDISPVLDEPHRDPESDIRQPLTYRQQLVIAALQGLCANPAYSSISDEIPGMAVDFAMSVSGMEIHQ